FSVGSVKLKRKFIKKMPIPLPTWLTPQIHTAYRRLVNITPLRAVPILEHFRPQRLPAKVLCAPTLRRREEFCYLIRVLRCSDRTTFCHPTMPNSWGRHQDPETLGRNARPQWRVTPGWLRRSEWLWRCLTTTVEADFQTKLSPTT